MLIGLGEDMTTIDFGFTRLRPRSQGSLVKNVNLVLLIILRTIYYRDFVFHMLIVLDGDMTRVDIELIMSKIKFKRITCKKCKHFCALSLELFITDILYFTC